MSLFNPSVRVLRDARPKFDRHPTSELLGLLNRWRAVGGAAAALATLVYVSYCRLEYNKEWRKCGGRKRMPRPKRLPGFYRRQHRYRGNRRTLQQLNVDLYDSIVGMRHFALTDNLEDQLRVFFDDLARIPTELAHRYAQWVSLVHRCDKHSAASAADYERTERAEVRELLRACQALQFAWVSRLRVETQLGFDACEGLVQDRLKESMLLILELATRLPDKCRLQCAYNCFTQGATAEWLKHACVDLTTEDLAEEDPEAFRRAPYSDVSRYGRLSLLKHTAATSTLLKAACVLGLWEHAIRLCENVLDHNTWYLEDSHTYSLQHPDEPDMYCVMHLLWDLTLPSQDDVPDGAIVSSRSLDSLLEATCTCMSCVCQRKQQAVLVPSRFTERPWQHYSHSFMASFMDLIVEARLTAELTVAFALDDHPDVSAYLDAQNIAADSVVAVAQRFLKDLAHLRHRRRVRDGFGVQLDTLTKRLDEQFSTVFNQWKGEFRAALHKLGVTDHEDAVINGVCSVLGVDSGAADTSFQLFELRDADEAWWAECRRQIPAFLAECTPMYADRDGLEEELGKAVSEPCGQLSQERLLMRLMAISSIPDATPDARQRMRHAALEEARQSSVFHRVAVKAVRAFAKMGVHAARYDALQWRRIRVVSYQRRAVTLWSESKEREAAMDKKFSKEWESLEVPANSFVHQTGSVVQMASVEDGLPLTGVYDANTNTLHLMQDLHIPAERRYHKHVYALQRTSVGTFRGTCKYDEFEDGKRSVVTMEVVIHVAEEPSPASLEHDQCVRNAWPQPLDVPVGCAYEEQQRADEERSIARRIAMSFADIHSPLELPGTAPSLLLLRAARRLSPDSDSADDPAYELFPTPWRSVFLW